MISKRMQAFTKNSSAIRAMFEEGKRLSAQYGAENVYDFSLGNPSVPPPPQVKAAIERVLEQDDPILVHGYTSNAGDESVRAFVADSVNREFGMAYDASLVVLTCGAAGALNILFKSILDPGDEVVVLTPYFGEYNAYVGSYDGVIVPVAADPTTFRPDLAALAAALSPRTRAVIINTPNNPTGVVYSAADLKELGELLAQAEQRYHREIILVADEPYRYLAYDGVQVPFVPHFYHNTVVAYSFSKALSLPGERIGYLLLHPDMSSREELANAINVANRITGFVNAPSLFQRILPDVMNLRVDMAPYAKNRDLAYGMLRELGFTCVKPEGAFYLFPQSPIPDDKAFCEAAKKERLLLVPGSSFAAPGYFRMATCVATETIVRSRDSFVRIAKQFGLR